MAGDRAITQDLMARLERHYIKPSEPLPGGIFVPEVGWNGSTNTRRCDAIYVGFTSTSGRLLVGHEVKASRADWLHELDQIHKADTWADQCHEWWLVTAPGVVHDGELPAGWGLMLPGTSATRMKVVVQARRHLERVPSWDAVRSILARQDTLRAQVIAEARTKVERDAQQSIERRAEDLAAANVRKADWDAGEVERLRQQVADYERALGGRVVPAGDCRHGFGAFTKDDLAELATLLRTHGELEKATEELVGRYSPLARLSEQFAALDQAIRAAARRAASTQKAGA